MLIFCSLDSVLKLLSFLISELTELFNSLISFTKSRKSSFFATKSVSQFISIKDFLYWSPLTATTPSLATRDIFLEAFEIPLTLKISAALSISPLASSIAVPQSLKPAPVDCLSCLIFSKSSKFASPSLENNIAYGDPWAKDEQITDAAFIAKIDNFIFGLPESYKTLVGERGVSLSGGQKQRISIARTIMLNPSVMILDDSTAAIDAETEVRIRAALMSHSHAITTIIISHRLVSVMHADEILFLEQGRIIERGTHSHLIALKGRYFELHALQMQSKQSTDLPLSTATSP